MNQIKKCAKLPPVKFSPNPVFGTVFAPTALRMELKLDGANEYAAEIRLLNEENLPPSTAGLHYGQSIFEGAKAFRQPDGSVKIFRPDLHAKRFRKSSKRMVMAEIPEEIFLHTLKEYVDFIADNVPSEPGHSLYLRPLMIAADPKIKVGASQNYLFYIMASVAGNYFGTGKIKPARVMVCREFVRAYPGGMGEVKTAANYAASIWPQRLASQKDCDQVLFLDATHHDYIDELGGMNFFAIRGQELMTPALNGCILDGITRRSILEISSSLGLKPVEARMSFSELKKDIESGRVQETFACGTAAVVHPIGEFLLQEKVGDSPVAVTLRSEPTMSLKIRDQLMAIQWGRMAAPWGS